MSEQIQVKEITITTAQEWIKRGALLVDVREKNEVDALAFDVPRIINIPLTEFEARYQELKKDDEMVVVCSVGERSLRAAAFLTYYGYDKVANMQQGLLKWIQQGLPIIGDINMIALPAEQHSCCGGHSHGHDHGHDHHHDHAEAGHHHSHDGDHECCGGHSHGEDHECCGGHSHDDDHECMCHPGEKHSHAKE